MTDKELIQALRYCEDYNNGDDVFAGLHCADCQYKADCNAITMTTAADRLEALIAENEDLTNQLIRRNDELLNLREQLPKWVSVEERLPEERQCVVALDRNNVVATGYFDGVWHGMFDHNGVTHWMPLPEPPSTEGVE